MAVYEVNATDNWWGNASGPYHSTTNPNGTGNAVSDNVLYEPWLTEPVPEGEAKPPAKPFDIPWLILLPAIIVIIIIIVVAGAGIGITRKRRK